MTDNPILDVAIGLILMYLLLSLVCTAINEHIATFAHMRAKTLQQALASLIDVEGLRNDFYNHGLISSSRSASGQQHPSYLSGVNFAMALVGSLNPAKPIMAFQDMESSIKALPDSDIRDMLLTQLTLANGKIDTLRDGIAAWFDSAMDRVSGVYKRDIKLISIIVAFILVVALNADSIFMAARLWKDQALRVEMSGVAAGVVKSDMAGCAVPPQTTSAQPAATEADGVDCPKAALADLKEFPIGWHMADVPKWQGNGLDASRLWLIKLFGLIMTAIAVSLGAPFWFDMLSKFVNIRGGGVKPARTDDA